MYTGTLIKDLMLMVERAEGAAQRKRFVDEKELQRMFLLRAPESQAERVFAGAA